MTTYISYPPKDPAEVITASLGFASRLELGETVESAVVSVQVLEGTDATPSAMLSGVASVIGSTVAQKLVGGVVGVTYLVKMLATTSTGRKLMGARSMVVNNGGAA